MFQERIR